MLKHSKLLLSFLLLIYAHIQFSTASAQQVVTNVTAKAVKRTYLDVPIHLSLSSLNVNFDEWKITLLEKKATGEYKPIDSQIDYSGGPDLLWIASGELKKGEVRHYQIVQTERAKTDSIIIKSTEVSLNKNTIDLSMSGTPKLSYQHSTHYPPDGVSELYKRSGFIHPLRSPKGNILTRINPPDHYHHVGIWNPWTKTTFDGHETDFWNLTKGQGTVRFAGINEMVQGDVYSSFSVRQEHVDFQTKGGDKVALNEVLDVRIWNTPSSSTENERYICDITSTLTCATDLPISLEQYRYGGGIGFRATEHWTNKNSWVSTSEGKDRKTADGTNAKWCDVWGEFPNNSQSGILFLSHPANRKHPEPMRVWPYDAQDGRGDVFFEFCPIRHEKWELLPGKKYVLKYRMIVHENNIEADRAENYWNSFADQPTLHFN